MFLIGLIVFYATASSWLKFLIFEVMYQEKAGLNWIEIVFYHNYLLIVAVLFGLLTVNPFPRHSDLFSLRIAYKRSELPHFFPFLNPFKVRRPQTLSLKGTLKLWILWQFVKWFITFTIVISLGGLPILGHFPLIFYAMTHGVGDWFLVPRVFMLPLVPASGQEIISLIPTMEIQYRALYVILVTLLGIVSVRMFLKLIRHVLQRERNLVVRDFFGVLTCLTSVIVLGAPYWSTDITTPYDYIIDVTLLVVFLLSAISFHFRGFSGSVLPTKFRTLSIFCATVIVIILLANASSIASLRLNWNNNWVNYEWIPLTSKKIEVTRWAAGIQDVDRLSISNLPSGNITKILSLVRQWDQEAAYTKMKNQIGVNWMTLSDSDIIYIHGREYWIAPTTIIYPSRDWISVHMIYTHATKMIAIDSHEGEFVSVAKVFQVNQEPMIYYGEGLRDEVYVNVKGFQEIGNTSYSGKADYVLSGWQRVLWFLVQGQFGFALSPPQESINMLYNRDVLQRVKDILIYGLNVDPDVYLVSDGNRVYFAAQVYVDYPLHSGFTGSNYLRFFAVVLVDVEDGSMHGYIVGKSDRFLIDFYKNYYSFWDSPPEWLLPQLRYPEALLGTHKIQGQLDIDFKYHVNDPFTWRSGSDFYERPVATEVHYVLTTKGEEVNFMGLQLVEFKDSPGRNLAGLYMAYNGPKLGQVELYSVTNTTAAQLIGPSAALQALDTDDYVRPQLTLLKNKRLGNILLYSIGHNLYYFIPVYITTEIENAVMTKMAFIVAIDATTGASVATGEDAAQAYYKITGSIPIEETKAEQRLEEIMKQFTSRGYSLVQPEKIYANVEIQIKNVTYTNDVMWSQTSYELNTFIQEYVEKYDQTEVYYWYTDNSTIKFGILVSDRGVVKLYYISILYK